LPLNYTVIDSGVLVAQCWWNLNGGINNSIDCGLNTTFDVLEEGENTINFYSNDTLGNPSFEMVEFFVDTRVPSIELVFPDEIDYLNYNLVNFSYIPSDERGLDMCILYGNWSGWEEKVYDDEIENVSLNYFNNIDLSSYGDGIYLWNVWCNNTIGSYSFAIANRTLTIDTTAPTVDFSSGTESSFLSFKRNWIFVNVSVVEENEENISFRLFNSQGGLVNSQTFIDKRRTLNWTGLSDGVYYYNVTVFDKVGFSDFTETREITLDTTPPKVKINSPLNKTYVMSEFPVTINVSLNEPGSLVFYSLDNWVTNISLTTSDNLNYLESLSYSGDGSYILRVFANDSLGNFNISEFVVFGVDSVSPIVNVLEPEQDKYYNYSLISFEVETNEPSIVNYSLDFGLTNFSMQENATDTGFLSSQILNDGVYTVNFYVWDIYGNENFSQARDFVVDSISPEIIFMDNTPENNLFSKETSFMINVSAYDLNLDEVILDWNGTEEFFQFSGDGYFWSEKNLLEGTYTFLAYANDSAGNFNFTETRTLNVDLTSPYFSLQNQTVNNIYTDRFFPGHELNLSAKWEDNYFLDYAWLSTNETGVWQNKTIYNSPLKLNGNLDVSSFIWENNSLPKGVYVSWKIYSNDTAGNINSTDEFSFSIWGHSEISEAFFVPKGVKVGFNSTIFCRVIDDFSLEGIENYNVSFYEGSNYLGSNLTDSDGYSRFLISGNDEFGTKEITCNITDDEPKYYIAEENYERSVVLGIGYSEDTYYFFTGIQGSWVYEGMTQFSTTLVSSDLYGLLRDNDDSYLTYTAPTDGQFSYQRFEIEIDEPLNELSYLEINWTGKGSSGGAAATAGYVIFFWNFTSSSWVQLVSQSGTAKGSHAFNYTTGFSDLVNSSGYVYVLARSLEARATGGSGGSRPRTIETDYVHVRTRSDILAPEVTLNYPDGLKTNNIQVDFSCFVHDDYEVVNVSLYGNWSTGWHLNQTNSSGLNDVNYTFVKNLSDGFYEWNCYSCDLAGNCDFDPFEHYLSVDTASPLVNLIYPQENFNFSSLYADSFNFSVSDSNLISNCSLYGDFEGLWEINQTDESILRNVGQSFLGVNVIEDGYYLWNVYCYDDHGNLGYNSTNFSFAAFNPPYTPPENINISQSSNDGTGNIVLNWSAVSNAVRYNIYRTNDLNDEFILIDETEDLGYVDSDAYLSRRRFYKVSAWNPTSENLSEIYAKTVYYFYRNPGVNTKNKAGFYFSSNMTKASELLGENGNFTSFNMYNETIQKRVICNGFSCPSFPECTQTNCNFDFDLEDGRGYEVYINSSGPLSINWSMVGQVFSPISIDLVKNDTNYGKNWISLYANTSLYNANSLINSISFAESVTNWDEVVQTSRGYIATSSPFPWIPPYIGNNFILEIEKSYEVSVNQSSSWLQE
jgi:hypothetical protein